jgi:hypothetical protein
MYSQSLHEAFHSYRFRQAAESSFFKNFMPELKQDISSGDVNAFQATRRIRISSPQNT